MIRRNNIGLLVNYCYDKSVKFLLNIRHKITEIKIKYDVLLFDQVDTFTRMRNHYFCYWVYLNKAKNFGA